MTSNRVGYARVSTSDQDLALQMDALSDCVKVFTDKASGSKAPRPGLDACLEYLQPRNTLVVWKLDRLGRSLSDLLNIVEDLEKRGVQFQSVTDGFNTTTAGGKMFFQIAGAFAEYEKNQIQERTHAGLAAARARGRVGGRPSTLSPKDVQRMREMYAGGELTVQQIANKFGVSRPTVYRHLETTEK